MTFRRAGQGLSVFGFVMLLLLHYFLPVNVLPEISAKVAKNPKEILDNGELTLTIFQLQSCSVDQYTMLYVFGFLIFGVGLLLIVLSPILEKKFQEKEQ